MFIIARIADHARCFWADLRYMIANQRRVARMNGIKVYVNGKRIR